jgi:hypothetical protein
MGANTVDIIKIILKIQSEVFNIILGKWVQIQLILF